MKEYVKIPNIFDRDLETRGHPLIPWKFATPELEFLKDCEWTFTEKVDGTNIGVVWDGYRVSFQGRTEVAEIPKPLYEYLESLFGGPENEEVFEKLFGEKEVILYGEGYGGKIGAAGPKYGGTKFILFDVMIGDLYLRRQDVEEIAAKFRIDVVPVVLRGTLADGVAFVTGHPKSTLADTIMEGVVGRPAVEMRDRRGYRVIVKIKQRDFPTPVA